MLSRRPEIISSKYALQKLTVSHFSASAGRNSSNEQSGNLVEKANPSTSTINPHGSHFGDSEGERD